MRQACVPSAQSHFYKFNDFDDSSSDFRKMHGYEIMRLAACFGTLYKSVSESETHEMAAVAELQLAPDDGDLVFDGFLLVIELLRYFLV